MSEVRENYKQLLQALLDRDWLKDPAHSIARKAIDQGLESLSGKQKDILEKYAFSPFSMFDLVDIFAIAERGYNGHNHQILEWAREVKQQLGYIPDENSPEGDFGYTESAFEDYDE